MKDVSTKPTRRLRCAIYTRKSSEEGLDMEFNSLDRDAVGGRNISLVGDAWSTRGSELADALRKSPDAFRLRRDANELLRSSSR